MHELKIGEATFEIDADPDEGALHAFAIAYGDLCEKHFNARPATISIQKDGVLFPNIPTS